MKYVNKKLGKQAGVTLIELIVGLVIIGLIVAGALAMFGTAQSSQSGIQTQVELNGIRAVTKGLFMGQGSYGVSGTNLNNILVTSKRIPSTIKVDLTTTPYTLTNSLSGTVNIVSTGAGFTLTETNIPADVCVAVMAGTQNWVSAKAGTATAVTVFPYTTTQAATDCATGTTLVFTGN